MFYNEYMNIDEIALKLDMSVDEIDKIISYYRTFLKFESQYHYYTYYNIYNSIR